MNREQQDAVTTKVLHTIDTTNHIHQLGTLERYVKLAVKQLNGVSGLIITTVYNAKHKQLTEG